MPWRHRGLGEGRVDEMTFQETEMEHTEKDAGLRLQGPRTGSHGASQDAALRPTGHLPSKTVWGEPVSHLLKASIYGS